MQPNLYLYTETFPYGKGESFVSAELNNLAIHYKHIFIIPLRDESSTNIFRIIPDNVTVVHLNKNPQQKSKITLSISSIINIYQSDWTRYRVKGLRKLTQLKSYLAYFRAAVRWANVLQSFINQQKATDAHHYSFWMNQQAISLAILKQNNYIQHCVVRVHGYDFFNERHPWGLIPFRHFVYDNMDKVLMISKAHIMYATDLYPEYSSKYQLAYLGTEMHAIVQEAPKLQNDIITIVSCAHILPIKRIDLIIKTLALVSKPINWIHFGTGPALDDFKSLIKGLPEFVKVTFKGHASMNEIMDFYQNNAINAFINVSASEGLPVAMMEAQSAGLYILATDVGGVKEIVSHPDLGVLIPVDFQLLTLKTLIENLQNDTISLRQYRKQQSRLHWEQNFDAAKNTDHLVKIIKSK